MAIHVQKTAWFAMCFAVLGACGSDEKPGEEAPDKCQGGRRCAVLPADAGHDAGHTEADASGSRRDAAAEPEVDAAPDKAIEGGPGCGVGSRCLLVRNAYAEAIQAAKGCSAGADESCGQQAAQSLGCESCPVWVTSTTKLDALKAQFEGADCGTCFFDSPTGDRCHPISCRALGVPMCTESGTCVADLSCPPEAVNGKPCVAESLSYCEEEGGSKYCLCLSEGWQCNF